MNTSASQDDLPKTRPLRFEITVDGATIRGPGGELPLSENDDAAQDFLLILAREVGGVRLERALKSRGYQSRATYYGKLKRYIQGGLAALLPQSPGPRGNSQRSSDIIKRIVSLRYADPRRNAAAIAAILKRSGIHISIRSIERTLTEYGLSKSR